MKFGPTPVADAEGAILAHSLRLDGAALKKGRRLSAADVRTIAETGVDSIVTARLEPGDVHEDEAADTLARALVAGAPTQALRLGAPFTGRSNVYATHAGLLEIDGRAIEALNSVHESVTVATLPPFAVVRPKQMLATVKIIPFAVEHAHLDAALASLRGAAPALRVRAFRGLRAGLIQTRLTGTRESVLDKTVGVIERRLAPLGGELVAEKRCAHDSAAVAATLDQMLALAPGVVMVAGASAIVDRRDVVPAGIEAAGGAVEHFGMPVDPGNLLLLARHGSVPVLGLPGCARSPKFNGFDQVLERLAAGLEVTRADVTALGAGGLLKEIHDRPQPRAAEHGAQPARAPHVAAVVLAAGQSRRMGSVNKLLAEVDGRPMVQIALEAAAGAGVDHCVVVTGHEAERVRAAVEGAGGMANLKLVHNPDYAQGLSASLAAGLRALPDGVEAALVVLGDMPRVRASHLARLIAAYDAAEGRAICVPTRRGKRGNPVLWDSRFFADMVALRGDVGARHLIGEYADLVCEVEMADDAVLTDVDSPAQMAAVVEGA